MADELRRLIRVRTAKGARFKRDGFGKKRQLADSWRKPRGQHNKQREQKKAKGALPKPGFGSPLAVRGMHPSGFFEVLVHTKDDLEGLNPKTQSIRIAATVGNRKRALIQERALAAGIRVLNARPEKPVKKAPAPAKEEKAEKPEKRKEKKTVPEKKGKTAKATVTKEKPAEKKAAPAEEKALVKKAAQEKVRPEPSEEPQKKEGQKKKAGKVPEARAEPKQKKARKAKEEPAAKEEAKPAKKAAAKPRKKTVKEGEEQ